MKCDLKSYNIVHICYYIKDKLETQGWGQTKDTNGICLKEEPVYDALKCWICGQLTRLLERSHFFMFSLFFINYLKAKE